MNYGLLLKKIPNLLEHDTFWIKTSDDVDMYMKGRLDPSLPEQMRRLNDKQLSWVGQLEKSDNIRLVFNTAFFTRADSREPESAGILGAVVGSAMALVVTIILALPLAVMAAIYLEYFAAPAGSPISSKSISIIWQRYHLLFLVFLAYLYF